MKKKMIVISLDAMIFEDIEKMRKLPYMGEIVKNGSVFKTSESVYPTLTYTAHASIISGTYPNKHGVVHNEMMNPFVYISDWFESRNDIKAAILPEILERAGYKVFVNSWPTLSGANVTYNAQRSSIHTANENRRDVMIAKSTPGLMESLWDICSEAWKRESHYEMSDLFSALATKHFIEQDDMPDVMFMHMTIIDSYRHRFGVHASEVDEALKYTDDMIGMVVDALKEKGIYEDTTIVLCSDHGQVDINKIVSANKLFIDKGWLKIDGDGNVLEWDAYVHSVGPSAHVYVRNKAIVDDVHKLLKDNKELLEIEDIFTKEEVNEKFNLRGDFEFVLEAQEGITFAWGVDAPLKGPVVGDDYKTSLGTHGHIPTKGSQPSLVFSGPNIKKGVTFDYARIVDIAPTCAHLLGVEMHGVDGKVLSEIIEVK